MVLTDYVPPVSWVDKGMDWINPNPADVNYINALKLALLERGWSALPLCMPGNPLRTSDISDVADGIARLTSSPYETIAFYEPRLTANGFPFQNVNDSEMSCVAVLPARCCLHTDLVPFFRNARRALKRMLFPSGIRVAQTLTTRSNYPGVSGYENEKSYEQVIQEAKDALSEAHIEVARKTLVSAQFQNTVFVSYYGTSIRIPGTDEYKKEIRVEATLQEIEFDFSDILTEDNASLTCYVLCNVTLPGSGLRVLDVGDIGLQEGYQLLTFEVDKGNPKFKIGDSLYFPTPEKPAIGTSVTQGFYCSLQLIVDVSKLGYRFI